MQPFSCITALYRHPLARGEVFVFGAVRLAPSNTSLAGAFLEKKSHGFLSSWQKRYFRIEGDLLCYYHEEPVMMAAVLRAVIDTLLPSLRKSASSMRASIWTTVEFRSTAENREQLHCIEWHSFISPACQWPCPFRRGKGP